MEDWVEAREEIPLLHNKYDSLSVSHEGMYYLHRPAQRVNDASTTMMIF